MSILYCTGYGGKEPSVFISVWKLKLGFGIAAWKKIGSFKLDSRGQHHQTSLAFEEPQYIFCSLYQVAYRVVRHKNLIDLGLDLW